MSSGVKLKCLSFLQVGYTSAPGQGGILAQREFDRRFSPHYVSVTFKKSSRCSFRLSNKSGLTHSQEKYTTRGGGILYLLAA